MHILYVDESGDPGHGNHSTLHYILSGLIVSEDNWDKYLQRLKSFRKSLKSKYDLNQRLEIHATELIRIKSIKEYTQIRKTDRINILKDYCGQIPIIFDDTKFINICLKKDQFPSTTDFALLAWNRLIQRFDTYLKKVAQDKGIIVSDDTDGASIMKLVRRMRVYNPVPSHFSKSHQAPTDSIIEDLFQRSSQHSYFIQTVDVVSHLLYRKEYPKGSLKKFGLEHQFDRLESVLLKEASKGDPHGIVRK